MNLADLLVYIFMCALKKEIFIFNSHPYLEKGSREDKYVYISQIDKKSSCEV